MNEARQRPKSPLPCLVCGRELENVVDPEMHCNQPSGACTFISAGHYGSTVFDPLDSSKLEINICDDCVMKAQSQRAVGYWPPHPKRRMEPWNGE